MQPPPLDREAANHLAAQVRAALAAAGKYGTTEVLQESSAQHWVVLLVWEDGLDIDTGRHTENTAGRAERAQHDQHEARWDVQDS
ncbi:hypothetical protein KSF_003780 [Reticulibacter mediterranei]|uniref:Uncharacterized protein n=1 Tax=Reticulibacter mediterranei TaxID=2778369 RepID=A0A8J3IGI4_9CHLR|nr:hypothetical protein [Reticulibacter mediterranei]GHO90330.1 hypothetical protein KSF_003780 [Reticulibacter mediterranei]